MHTLPNMHNHTLCITEVYIITVCQIHQIVVILDCGGVFGGCRLCNSLVAC